MHISYIPECTVVREDVAVIEEVDVIMGVDEMAVGDVGAMVDSRCDGAMVDCRCVDVMVD